MVCVSHTLHWDLKSKEIFVNLHKTKIGLGLFNAPQKITLI